LGAQNVIFKRTLGLFTSAKEILAIANILYDGDFWRPYRIDSGLRRCAIRLHIILDQD
jgi:hypothetical protein